MLDTHAFHQTLPSLSPAQQQTLKRITQTILEQTDESLQFQTHQLLEHGFPLAQAAQAVKVLSQVGVLGQEDNHRRPLNCACAEALIAAIDQNLVHS